MTLIRFLQVVALLLLTCVGTCSTAADRLSPGDKVSLSDDEGLVAFVIDSDNEVAQVTLDRLGSMSFPAIEGQAAGRYLRVMKLKAGDYRFNQMKLGYTGMVRHHFNLRHIPNSKFTVHPGQMNYLGDLVARGSYWQRSIRIQNAGLGAFDLVEREFPGLIKRYPWNYVGEYPDDFMKFRAAEVERVRPGTKVSEPQLPDPSIGARDWSERLFRARENENIQLDPSGRYVFESRVVDGTLSIRMTDLTNSLRRSLYIGPESLASLVFIGEARVVVGLQNAAGEVRSIGLSMNDPDQMNPVEFAFGGQVVDGIPGSDHEAIVTNSENGVRLFRLDLRQAHLPKALKNAEELQRKIKDDWFWWIDSSSTPRLMLSRDSDSETAKFRFFPIDGGEPREFSVKLRENESLTIQGIERTGRVLALTDFDRDQMELVEVDSQTGALVSTVVSRPGRDLLAAGIGKDGALSWVSYLVNGQYEKEMLTDGERELSKSIAAALPGRSVFTSPAAKNGRRIVFSFGSSDPGTYYIYESGTRKLTLLAHRAPQLAGRALAASESFSVRAADGFDVEALLTRLPDAGVIRPLLVIPHGGPMGIFDSSRFDPEVQFFAQLGYAVLQVNFRGSGARGKSAMERGQRELGKGIEDDIDLAVDGALERGLIDANRIAVLGSSYGGYSAVMLGILKPERYKASVAIAGAFDLTLQFSGSDAVGREKSLKMLEKWFGNPKTDYAEMKSVSPVYQYERIRNPLLVVHDRGDSRVPFEHARRLQEMLRLSGRPAAFIATNDSTHGLANASTAILQYPLIAAFLAQHLAASSQGKRPH